MVALALHSQILTAVGYRLRFSGLGCKDIWTYRWVPSFWRNTEVSNKNVLFQRDVWLVLCFNLIYGELFMKTLIEF
jgi:hypothetical protein